MEKFKVEKTNFLHDKYRSTLQLRFVRVKVIFVTRTSFILDG